MKPSKYRRQQLDVIKKFEGQTLVPLVFLYAKYRRGVIDAALESGLIAPAVKAPKAVLFHSEAVSTFDRALASGQTVITKKREVRE